MAATHALPAADASAEPRVQMREAARSFLASLSEDQRGRAQLALKDSARTEMSYFPGERAGLSLNNMNRDQQELARRLLASALSEAGALKAGTIMRLEQVLRDMGGGKMRDPELYYFAVFGEPGEGAWGWRAEGHHLSVNLTLTDDGIADTPSFFGANPGVVREGEKIVSRPLAAEEDLARQLVKSFDAKQRETAVIAAKAPREIITGRDRRITREKPAGLAHEDLPREQQDLLVRLIKEYVGRHRAELAAQDWEKMERAGLGAVHFAWAGGLEPGEGHYYRIQGPTFLMEYDNTQNGANHIHTVWRDFDGDYGRDALREHYDSSPH